MAISIIGRLFIYAIVIFFCTERHCYYHHSLRRTLVRPVTLFSNTSTSLIIFKFIFMQHFTLNPFGVRNTYCIFFSGFHSELCKLNPFGVTSISYGTENPFIIITLIIRCFASHTHHSRPLLI